MRRLIVIMVMVFGVVGMLYAQHNDSMFYFDDHSSSIDYKSVDLSLVPKNYFGDDIALKLYILQRNYTYITKGTASSPGDKIQVEKPTLYNALKKMSRYYKTLAKKGIMPQEEAKTKLDRILNIGLSVKNQPTKDLEDALRKAKKSEEMAKVFERVVLE